MPGLAALVALVFTWVSVGQTGTELRIAEQGQITTRFNAAVSHLGSQSLDLRFGGIYALERIMQDSPRDQPRVVSVLSAYVRTHTPVPAAGFPKMTSVAPPPDADVTAAVDVLAERPLGRDGRARIDWQGADLRSLRLVSQRPTDKGDLTAHRYLPFSFADLRGADLRDSILVGVDAHGAWFHNANMAYVHLQDVNLKGAVMYATDLTGASLTQTSLQGAQLPYAIMVGADLTRTDLRSARMQNAAANDAFLDQADLRNAHLVFANLRSASLTAADLRDARLYGADLRKADLKEANLSDADLEEANLSDADLEGANLRGASLHLADLRGADLAGADLTGADLDQAKGVPAELLDR
ncbi:pentapeptide repeat-containing protein [Streptomyces virginiae]|uniref:pentapeptide repeat-containing protein n=1 Tax=Streptomyces virginiae TaxID=1961 RepID=UPI0033A1B438